MTQRPQPAAFLAWPPSCTLRLVDGFPTTAPIVLTPADEHSVLQPFPGARGLQVGADWTQHLATLFNQARKVLGALATLERRWEGGSSRRLLRRQATQCTMVPLSRRYSLHVSSQFVCSTVHTTVAKGAASLTAYLAWQMRHQASSQAETWKRSFDAALFRHMRTIAVWALGTEAEPTHTKVPPIQVRHGNHDANADDNDNDGHSPSTANGAFVLPAVLHLCTAWLTWCRTLALSSHAPDGDDGTRFGLRRTVDFLLHHVLLRLTAAAPHACWLGPCLARAARPGVHSMRIVSGIGAVWCSLMSAVEDKGGGIQDSFWAVFNQSVEALILGDSPVHPAAAKHAAMLLAADTQRIQAHRRHMQQLWALVAWDAMAGALELHPFAVGGRTVAITKESK